MTNTPRAELDRELLLSGQVDNTDAYRFAAASAPDAGPVGCETVDDLSPREPSVIEQGLIDALEELIDIHGWAETDSCNCHDCRAIRRARAAIARARGEEGR